MKFLPDAFLVAGAAAIAYGAYLAWEPAGFLVGGFLALVTGVKLASAK